MRRMRNSALLPAAVLLLLAAAPGKAGNSPFANVSRRVFADLLKIPLEPPAVSATVDSSREEDGLIIEDVSWPSIDNDRVQAYVVRPAKAAGRLPAIVCLHGSSTNRDVDIAPKYEYGEWTRYGSDRKGRTLFGWARELARHGYITLAMTQRGLDRRLPDTESRDKDLLVHGRNVMGTIIYEIRQSVSYLQQRQEVDAARIGMTGISFGGITTFYTWLVDDRIAAAAPICGGIGSIQEFINHGARTYHGIYWWIPDMLTRGDQGDFAAAMAPRPLMLWAPAQDIGMPNQGIDKFLEATVPAYKQAGAADRLVVHRPPGEHALTKESVEAAKQFFDRFLCDR
jgi:dienelactone hydrolase